MDGVGISIWRVSDAHGGVTEAGADDGAECGGDDNPKKRKGKYFPRWCLGWVIAVVVRCDRAPPGGVREVDGHEGKERP